MLSLNSDRRSAESVVIFLAAVPAGAGKPQPKSAAGARFAFQLDATPVFMHDPGHNGQAQARALAVVLGGEKGQKNPVVVFGGRCPRPCPRNPPESPPVRPPSRRISMRPPLGMASRALASRLKNTCSSSLRLPNTKGSVFFGDGQLHARQLQVLFHQVGGFVDRLGQVHAAAFAAGGPGEIQKSLDDAAALLGLSDDPADVLAVVFVLDGAPRASGPTAEWNPGAC